MRTNLSKEHIPWLMAAARALLGPVLIVGAECGWNGLALAGIVVAALLSDIYDGVLARRWKCDTAGVRFFDSMADTVFYLCTAVAFWIRLPLLWQSYAGLLVGLLALEGVRFAFDFVKFGRPASYHSYLAKAWGLVMAIAVIGSFAAQRASVLVPVALVLGIVCDLEGLAMSWVMPLWRKDIKTLREAWRIRERFRSWEMRRVRSGRLAFGGRQKFVFGGFFMLALCVVLVLPACAVEAGQVAYVGGSLSVTQGTIGSFDTTSPTALIFRSGGSGVSSNEVDIGYKSIRGFAYTTEVAHHLGVLPAVAVGLVKRRERKHFLTLRFSDSAGVAQAAVFEVAKNDPPVLLAILHARAPQACGSPMLNCGYGQGNRPGVAVPPLPTQTTPTIPERR
jgi:phosphatidylglycerophosphate synthase